jgi:hypothetical protein
MGLSGWQRLGIAASFVWLFTSGWVVTSKFMDEAAQDAFLDFNACVEANKVRFGEYGAYDDQVWTPCHNKLDQFYAVHVKDHQWGNALNVAALPILPAWMLTWGLLSASRWIRRGSRHDDPKQHSMP